MFDKVKLRQERVKGIIEVVTSSLLGFLLLLIKTRGINSRQSFGKMDMFKN